MHSECFESMDCPSSSSESCSSPSSSSRMDMSSFEEWDSDLGYGERSQCRVIPAAADWLHPKDEQGEMASFEKKINIIGWLALGAVGLHKLTSFLGFCALTWASVAILGGLLSSLRIRDFYLVSTLLIIEALRFAQAMFLSNLVTRDLESLTFSRHSFDHKRKKFLLLLRIIAPATQFLFITPSIIFPMFGLRSTHHYLTSMSEYTEEALADILIASLNGFYYIVLIKALFATFSLIYSLVITITLQQYSNEETLQRYYDEVLWKGISKGLLEASKLGIFEFGFDVQAQEYSRGMLPKVVQTKYGDLIKYIFYHPRGVESALLTLMPHNPYYQQQAVVNMVGLWATIDVRGTLRFQNALLMRLADMLETFGQISWAVSNTFKVLGEKLGPEIITDISNCQGVKVFDILIDAINAKNWLSMQRVRALLPLLPYLSTKNMISQERLEILDQSLKEIISSENIYVAQRMSAAYALYLLGRLKKNEMRILENMKANNVEYYLREEHKYIMKILGHVPNGCRRMPIMDAEQPSEQPFFLVLSVVLLSLSCIGTIVFVIIHFTINKLKMF